MGKKASNPPPPELAQKPPPPPAPPWSNLVEHELHKLWVMYNPTADAVRKFLGPDSDGMHDDSMLGAIHKARVIEMASMLDESVKWLEAHDMDIPENREEILERSRKAAKRLGLIKEYKH